MSRLQQLQAKLKELEGSETSEDFPGQTAEYRRHITVEAAVQAAQELVMEGSDGSVEETDYLMGTVTAKLMEKVQGRLGSVLLRKELADRSKPNADTKDAKTS